MILIWYTIWYASQFSHYLAVIKLNITRFVDDVRDHQKYRIRTSSIFMCRYLFMPTCMQTSNKPLQGDSDASTTINAETCCSGGRTGLMKRWGNATHHTTTPSCSALLMKYVTRHITSTSSAASTSIASPSSVINALPITLANFVLPPDKISRT